MTARFLSDEAAASSIEYALIATLIAVVLVTALTTLGSRLNTHYTSAGSALAR
jgi:pilus assembly protein Flp/PilA